MLRPLYVKSHFQMDSCGHTLNREKENNLFANFLLLLQCWIEQILKMFGREFEETFCSLECKR